MFKEEEDQTGGDEQNQLQLIEVDHLRLGNEFTA